MTVIEELHRAREAYERREWVTAYRALSSLDDVHLSGFDFATLAMSAHLLGRRNDCVQALQRAYETLLAGQDRLGAVRAAYWLTMVLSEGGEPVVAGGWLARAERLLDLHGEDAVEHGYVLIARMLQHIGTGQFTRARDAASAVTDYGSRFGDANLVATGLNAQGRLLTAAGKVQEGLRLVDEAMVGVVAGELETVFAGQVYCSTIEACQWVGDLGRMVQWTQALTQWCEAQPGLVAFTGQAAVHRGQLMRVQGAFHDALLELQQAVDRYAVVGGHPAMALAHAERGDVLRLLGDLDAAEEAYTQAVHHGLDAQPGRALLWLVRGRAEAAVAAVRRCLAGTELAMVRNRLLPGAVEVLVEADELNEAAALAAELATIAADFGCISLRAASGYAAAQVALARDDPEDALTAVRPALVEWASLGAVYEVARCRVLLSRALRRLEDDGSAVAELRAARDAFASIGARPAEQEASALLDPSALPSGLSPREVEVLGLVAAGLSNAQIAAELFLSERTVARHLSNIFGKLDVTSRTAAAAFAFEHRLVPSGSHGPQGSPGRPG